MNVLGGEEILPPIHPHQHNNITTSDVKQSNNRVMNQDKLFFAKHVTSSVAISFRARNEKEARSMMRIFFGVDRLYAFEVWQG